MFQQNHHIQQQYLIRVNLAGRLQFLAQGGDNCRVHRITVRTQYTYVCFSDFGVFAGERILHGFDCLDQCSHVL